MSSGYYAALFVNPGDLQAQEITSDGSGANLPWDRNDNDMNTSFPSDRPKDRRVEATSLNNIGSADVPEDRSKTKSMWILLCFYNNRNTSKAVHLNFDEGYDDIVLTKLFWEKYYETRGWFAYYMFWKGVTKISFVKVRKQRRQLNTTNYLR